MDQSPQTIADQCRKHGRCILSKEEFESVFLPDVGAPGPNLIAFCLQNDLELVVEVEAMRFVFRASQQDQENSWCNAGGGAKRWIPF